MSTQNISVDLYQSQILLESELHLKINPDIKRRTFVVFGQPAVCYALDGMVSTEFLQRYILEPCLKHAASTFPAPLADALMQLIPINEIIKVQMIDEAAANIMIGKAVLLCHGMPCALCMDIRMFVRRGIGQPLTESVINGPHQGFNESIRDNLTLLRRILPTAALISEMKSIGTRIPTSLAIVYLQPWCDMQHVDTIKQRLDGIKADHILSIGALEQLIEDHPYSLLPQCCLTERPDRAASFLLEGQVLLILDGSPQVLCMPVSLFHLLHTPDDTSMRFQASSFIRVVRYLGALCTLLLPALFVALVTFHPQVLPVTLLTSILESQASIPLPIAVEALLLLLMFNLIIEAGIRIPGIVGATLGTVSGLILGQTAVEAHLVHPLLIVVIAVASLGSFVVPDYSLSVALRIGQLLYIAAAAVFGIYGMVLLSTVLVIRTCSLQSLRSPYLAPLSPGRMHNPDVLLRAPLWHQRCSTWLANARFRMRINGRARAWEVKQHDKPRP